MNIYQLEQDFLNIFEEIEDNDGELTPELEERLNIVQDAFKDKIKSYCNVVKHYKSELEEIKAEQKRLKELYDRKEKTISRINSVIITAVNKFGDTTKTGGKFVDYGTGKVSVKRNTSVDINSDKVKGIVEHFNHLINVLEEDNQLYISDKIDKVEFTDAIENLYSEYITDNDLDTIKTSVSFNFTLGDLMYGEGFNLIRNILINTNENISIKPNISKTDLKEYINSGNESNIGKIVQTESLIIK